MLTDLAGWLAPNREPIRSNGATLESSSRMMETVVRKMADPKFRKTQELRRLEAHIAPINNFVLKIRDKDGRGWAPEVAPMHGGVDARVLSILRDPGPATQQDSGSGFLCIENDDPTAERQAELFTHYNIAPRGVLPWNAYPWYINSAPNATQLEAGAEVLVDLIDHMPALRVVLLQGTHAASVWKRALKRRPKIEADRQLTVVESIHPGRQALWTPDPAVRQARLDKQHLAYLRVAEALAESE